MATVSENGEQSVRAQAPDYLPHQLRRGQRRCHRRRLTQNRPERFHLNSAPRQGSKQRPDWGIASNSEVLRAVQNGRNLFVRKDLWKQVVPETRLGESEYFKISQKAEAPSLSTVRVFLVSYLLVE